MLSTKFNNHTADIQAEATTATTESNLTDLHAPDQEKKPSNLPNDPVKAPAASQPAETTVTAIPTVDRIQDASSIKSHARETGVDVLPRCDEVVDAVLPNGPKANKADDVPLGMCYCVGRRILPLPWINEWAPLLFIYLYDDGLLRTDVRGSRIIAHAYLHVVICIDVVCPIYYANQSFRQDIAFNTIPY